MLRIQGMVLMEGEGQKSVGFNLILISPGYLREFRKVSYPFIYKCGQISIGSTADVSILILSNTLARSK